MKILYAVQATGNGHIQRASEIIPILKKLADVDILISGCQSEVQLPFPVEYQSQGVSFIFGKKGGIQLNKTLQQFNRKRIKTEIKHLPVQCYDLVLNDFEPISAFAAKQKNIPCISLSHQAAVLHPQSPKPKRRDWLGWNIMKYYAPTDKQYGFHFDTYASNIFSPVIRKAIRSVEPIDQGHYTVYLPAYSDEILAAILQQFPDVSWQVFSKNCRVESINGNIHFSPIGEHSFLQSFATCRGVLCGAGFETPAEALFLGKKLMVVPMKNQYEQQCNAAALKQMGIPVIKKLTTKKIPQIQKWLSSTAPERIHYPDQTEVLLSTILSDGV